MKTKLTWLDRIMAAVTFAEANEHASAGELLKGGAGTKKYRTECPECGCILGADLQGVKANS